MVVEDREGKFRYKVVYETNDERLRVTYKNADNLEDMYEQMLRIYDFRRIHKFEKAAGDIREEAGQ